jgi:hypothetical protein
MQKEKFQLYLYNQESLKSADISELKEVLNEFPWFSTASIILLVCSRLQSSPDFNQLLKKHSFNITNRKLLSKLLNRGFENSDQTEDLHEGKSESQGHHSRISGIFDSVEMDNSAIENQSDVQAPIDLIDDSLLDFSYSAKKTDSAILERNDFEISVSDELLNCETVNDEDISNKISGQNFNHWIEKLGSASEIKKSPFKKHHIIESFIHSDPGVIRADKVSAIQGDVSKDSAEENEGFITDTLAKIYVKQGLYNKAIYAYEKLCLKYPEKSIYFASQIEEIKNLYIKK